MDYVLGYTASNDVSSRAKQFSQSQWCFSKGFDGACPIGPTLVSAELVPDPKKFRVRGLKNGEEMQNCGVEYVPIFEFFECALLNDSSDLIFNIPCLLYTSPSPRDGLLSRMPSSA